jgi:hypothetical protein
MAKEAISNDKLTDILMEGIYRAYSKIADLIGDIYFQDICPKEKRRSQEETINAIKALKKPADEIIEEEFTNTEQIIAKTWKIDEQQFAEKYKSAFSDTVNDICLSFTKDFILNGLLNHKIDLGIKNPKLQGMLCGRSDLGWFIEAAEELFAEKKS